MVCAEGGRRFEMKYELFTERDKVDLEVVHKFLSECYWAENIPLEVVKRSVDNSFCFSIYAGRDQVAFGRVISDCATFAYVCDIFVLEGHRGNGLSKRLMSAMLAHPDLQRLKRWVLVTKDAHGLYRQYGFTPLSAPDLYMEINRMGIWKNPELFPG